MSSHEISNKEKNFLQQEKDLRKHLEELQKMNAGNVWNSKHSMAEQQRRQLEDDFARWKQMQAGQVAIGAGQDGFIGGYGLGQYPQAMPQQDAQPEAREVQRQMQYLDHAINHLVHAVSELNERTRDIQLVQPTATEQEKVASQPSSPLAQVMANAIAMIDGQVEKIEAMNRRIQL